MSPPEMKASTTASLSNSNKHEDGNNNDDNDISPYYFLSVSASKELLKFQYKGEDRSLLYYYVLSPLASFLVNNCTPSTLAPNSITLLGLCFMMVSYLTIWYYAPMLEHPSEGELPRWIYLLNGISLFAYQTLDNMDGKQARRTGSSSPLGLLFDHGCDAVNSVFGCANWMISVALHPPTQLFGCFIMIFAPLIVFYFGTWEEYYTGALIMPIFNGPSDAVIIGVLMCLTSWWYGPQFWQGTAWWSAITSCLPSCNSSLCETVQSWVPKEGWPNLKFLLLVAAVAATQESLIKGYGVVRVYGWYALLNLVPLATLVGCTIIVVYVDAHIWLDMPRTTLTLISCLFVEMTTALMLDHITKQEYKPFRLALLPFVVFTVVVALGYLKRGDELTCNFLLMYMAGVAVFLITKSVVLIHEICDVLDVWCFDITTPRRRRRISNTVMNGHKKVA